MQSWFLQKALEKASSYRSDRRSVGSAGSPAPAAPWRPSGCGSTAPWPAGRPVPAERGVPPPPACASSPPPERGPRCGPSFRRCTCASSSETASAFSLLAARAAALARFSMRCSSVMCASKPVTLSLDVAEAAAGPGSDAVGATDSRIASKIHFVNGTMSYFNSSFLSAACKSKPAKSGLFRR
eukprot:4845527-Pleurochrysis_carterae.AAC.1